ncbi:MAG: PEGA domain-containing protein [Methanomicrobiales archaeon]
MKMPGKRPELAQKRHLNLCVVVVLLLMIVVSLSAVAADDSISPSCSDVDQFGNPICPILQPVDPFITVQGNNIEILGNFTGFNGPVGQVKGLAQLLLGNGTRFLEIAGSGVTGSINQTRHAGDYVAPGNNEPETATESSRPEEIPGIKGRMIELAEVAGLGMKSSINQTLHADEYSSLTASDQSIPTEIIEEGEDDVPAPNILRVTYANIIRSVLQFMDISPRAIKGSLRNYSAGNRSIWTNRSADDLIGSPLYAPDPDERFLPKPELPVTRLIKNVTPNLSQLLVTSPAPGATIPVKPVPTPVPAPVFNLSVDSDPEGALIVLNENRTGTTPFIMTGLEQKTYTLTLTRSGYLVYREVVTLDSDKALDIPLTPSMDALFVTPGKSTSQNKYGGIYVTSFPDQLHLTIDGVEVTGGTPFLYYGLPEGLHTIQVERTDKGSGPATYSRSAFVYHDTLTTFNIDTEEVLLVKRVSISPGPFSGAEFTINGKYPSGRLPATISTGCPGSFISVRKGDSYNSFLVPCTNQDTEILNLATNQEPHPPLLISSAPDGAEIFMDGFRTGYLTPHTFNDVSAGLHRIMVSKPGWYPNEEIVTVEIRGTNTTPQKVFFPMENYGEGTIVVDSLPRGAAIYLNGWSSGEITPHTFDHMKIGFYEIIVQMGSKPWIEQTELTPSKVSKVVADFNI